MTLRISWSGLRTHEECKQKGYLKRTGNKAKLTDTRMYFPGTVTDRVVRDWLANDPESHPGAMPGMVEEIMERERQTILAEGDNLKWRDANDRLSVLKDCKEAVTKIEADLNEFVLPYKYDVDFKFQAPLMLPHPDGGMDQVLLIGYMDIIVKRELPDGSAQWYVYDVKHTKDEGYWRKTGAQVGFYDLASLIMFGQNLEEAALLQPLCKETYKDIPLNGESRSQLYQRIIGMATDNWLNDHTPRVDNTKCGYCEVKNACSKFQPIAGTKRVAF